MNGEPSHPFLFAFTMMLLFFAGVRIGADPLLLGLAISFLGLTLFLSKRGGLFQSKESMEDFFWGLSILPRGFLLSALIIAPLFAALIFILDVPFDTTLMILAYPFVWFGVVMSIGLWKILGENRDSDKGRPYGLGKRP